jgi:parvulin-like peptidyl-prolyl isomerase
MIAVNDKSITRNEVQQYRQLQEQELRSQFQGEELKQKLSALDKEMVQQLVDDLLLEAFATQRKIEVSDKEIEERVDNIVRRQPNLQDQYTDEQLKSFVLKDLLRRRVLAREVDARVRVRNTEIAAACSKQSLDSRELDVGHILLRTGEPNARTRLETLRKQLLNGAKFEELALQYSQDPSVTSNKGRLGFISHGQFVKPFEEAAFALKPGEVSEPVSTTFGTHLIMVFGQRNKGPVDCDKLDDVTRQALENQIFAKKREEELVSFMARMRKQADIRISGTP